MDSHYFNLVLQKSHRMHSFNFAAQNVGFQGCSVNIDVGNDIAHGFCGNLGRK